MRDGDYKLAATLFIAKHEKELRAYTDLSNPVSMDHLVQLKKELFGSKAHREYAGLISHCCAVLKARDEDATRPASES